MNSVRSNNISLKYSTFTTLGSKDIGIINSEFVANTQFLYRVTYWKFNRFLFFSIALENMKNLNFTSNLVWFYVLSIYLRNTPIISNLIWENSKFFNLIFDYSLKSYNGSFLKILQII